MYSFNIDRKCRIETLVITRFLLIITQLNISGCKTSRIFVFPKFQIKFGLCLISL